MRLTNKAWNNYITRLSAINSKAGEDMRIWMEAHPNADISDVIGYAHAVATKYGEASATLACEMYDALALAQGAKVPPALPAETASMHDTAVAVVGTKMRGDVLVPNAIVRLVKMAGQDTTLQNALRDGAEWAWIPSGDTCSFCITLASRGWQRASKKAIKGGHAEHIHANCDCAYAIRFNPFDDVEGYEPDKYLDMYNAESGSPEDKINAMRRKNYAENKDKINAQKREAYARRKQLAEEGK